MLGGKRKGAGRKKGSKTLLRLRDHITKKDVEELIAKAKEKAREGDTKLLVFMLEQIFGKAPQSIEFPGGEGEIKISWKK